MVNWYRILKKLKPLCPKHLDSLTEVLKYLYEEKEYSLTQIQSLVDRETLGTATLSSKLKKLGIEVRKRGGDNCSKELYLTKQDFLEHSPRELAKKYNVHVTTIYNRKHKLLP